MRRREHPAPGAEEPSPPAAPGFGGVAMADLVPAGVRIDGDSRARPALLLVVAGGSLVEARLVARPPAEVEAVAEVLARGLADAGLPGPGIGPPRVLVRHEDVARALGPMLAPGMAVAAAAMLPALDAAADDARAGFGLALTPPSSAPETWAAWDLPVETVAALFAAAADFYATAPWCEVEPEQRIGVTEPGGVEWSATVLGFDGTACGLDLERRGSGGGWDSGGGAGAESGASTDADVQPRVSCPAVARRSVSLYYSSPQLLSAAAREEIRASGWALAAGDAWPRLTARGTPGGGIDRATARTLMAVLRATPGFVTAQVAAFRGAPDATLPAEAVDEETGLRLSYHGYAWPEAAGPWQAIEALEPGGTEGPGAAGAAATPAALLEGFAAYLVARGEAPTEVGWHTADAEFFLAFLDRHRGVALADVHEADLRLFLYDWLPRHGRDLGDEALETVRSLGRFFAFLAAEGHVVCPWAEDLLADASTFDQRCRSFPGPDAGPALAAWEAELSDDLLRRVMVPMDGRAGGAPGAATATAPRAATSAGEADAGGPAAGIDRPWLAAREDLVADGVVEPSLVRAALVRQAGQRRAE